MYSYANAIATQSRVYRFAVCRTFCFSCPSCDCSLSAVSRWPDGPTWEHRQIESMRDDYGPTLNSTQLYNNLKSVYSTCAVLIAPFMCSLRRSLASVTWMLQGLWSAFITGVTLCVTDTCCHRGLGLSQDLGLLLADDGLLPSVAMWGRLGVTCAHGCHRGTVWAAQKPREGRCVVISW